MALYISLERLKKTTKNLREYDRSLDQYSNWRSPGYEVQLLTIAYEETEYRNKNLLVPMTENGACQEECVYLNDSYFLWSNT